MSNVVATSRVSSRQMEERLIKVLPENNQSFNLILSEGTREVAKGERNTNIPDESNKQSVFWRNTLEVKTEKLNYHISIDNLASKALLSHKSNEMVIHSSSKYL